jgi:hypothetical protein
MSEYVHAQLALIYLRYLRDVVEVLKRSIQLDDRTFHISKRWGLRQAAIAFTQADPITPFQHLANVFPIREDFSCAAQIANHHIVVKVQCSSWIDRK